MNLITLVRGEAGTLERASTATLSIYGLRIIGSDYLNQVLASWFAHWVPCGKLLNYSVPQFFSPRKKA